MKGIEVRIHHLRFRAMSCEMAAWVVSADHHAARAHLITARDFIQTVEAQLSRFRPQSELSRLNAQPGHPVQVGPMLWEVLGYALEAARETGGLYDPTVLDALEAAGYDRSFDDRRPSETRRQGDKETRGPSACPVEWTQFHRACRSSVTPKVSSSPHLLVSLSQKRRSAVSPRPLAWQAIRLDPHTRSVTLPPGVRLDLGGIAKGWAADRAAERLAALGPCLVDAGGDIAARGAPPGQPGWPIGVADPRNPNSDLTLLQIRDRGVATSGVDYRRWVHDGAIQHHIIDPRTHRPAQTDLLTVTVVAPDTTQADLHALVALLLGSREGRRYLARQRGVEGLLVREDGRRFTTPGWGRYTYEG